MVLYNMHLQGIDAIKSPGKINLIAVRKSSNLKWLVLINLFNFFKFKINRYDPSGFFIKKYDNRN